ncbi:cytoplasmic dynein heavy chain, putative [Babesia bigemina]|uniref:Dynein heavy chain, cytoplasmic n=1 Tax=Babesia bigemina TaxID=5866 RepID=A0A061D2T2_BABBI|nr:cytoplasmic dynein heavy chain, putative [Babesia bigemina]CDR94382.1 cytoplasmic dynein heavy chain, putative [Babesia bigemina]|eukprot:XP_012766568.1 cytoplasmic dynein heavy chain, putative [Babesia bigemina]
MRAQSSKYSDGAQSTISETVFTRGLNEVAAITSAYFDIDKEAVIECLSKNEDVVREALFGAGATGNPLVAILDGEGESPSITLQRGWNDAISDTKTAIAFIAVKKGEDTKDNPDGVSYHIFPFMWKPGFSSVNIAFRLLNDVINPLVENLKYRESEDEKRHGYINEAANGVNRLCNLFLQLDCRSTVRYANFHVGTSLSRVAIYMGRDVKNWNIEIPTEVMLEDIKNNVIEWSIEIARVLGLYAIAMHEESDSDGSKSSDDAEEDDGYSMTSSDQSSIHSSPSILSVIELESNNTVSDMDIHDIPQIPTFVIRSARCGKPMNLRDEVSFWLNYENALLDLQEQIASTTVQYTLGLLEFNSVDINRIYCFADAVDAASNLTDRVENINILMKVFPVDELRCANSMGQLKEGIYTVLKHLEKIKYVRYYTNRKITEMVMGLTQDLLQSCYLQFHQHIKSELAGERRKSFLQSMDEIIHIWKNGLTQLKRHLEKEMSDLRAFSTDESLSMLYDARNVINEFHLCQSQKEAVSNDVEILLNIKTAFERIHGERHTASTMGTDNIKKASDLSVELYKCFLINVDRKLAENSGEIFDFNIILPCIDSYVHVLRKVEKVLTDSFCCFIGSVRGLNGILQLLRSANRLSICNNPLMTSHALLNTVNVIRHEIEALAAELDPENSAAFYMKYLYLDAAATRTINIARIRGKLKVFEEVLNLMRPLVDAGYLKVAHDCLRALPLQDLEVSLNIPSPPTLYMQQNILRIVDDEVESSKNLFSLNTPSCFDQTIEHLYMNCLADPSKDICFTTLESTISTIVTFRLTYEALVELVEAHPHLENSPDIPVHSFEDDLYEMLKNKKWEDILDPTYFREAVKSLNHIFLRFCHLIASASFNDSMFAYTHSFNAYEYFSTVVGYIRQQKVFFETHVGHDVISFVPHLIRQVKTSTIHWHNTAVKRWVSEISDAAFDDHEYYVQFVEDEDNDEIVMDPPCENIRQDLYDKLKNFVDIPTAIADELKSLFPTEKFKEWEDTNDYLAPAHAAITSILTNLQQQFNNYRFFEQTWQTYFKSKIYEQTDIDSILQELDDVLRSTLIQTQASIAPLHISLSDTLRQRKQKNMQTAVMNVVCENALDSALRMTHEFHQISEMMGLSNSDQSANVSRSASGSSSTTVSTTGVTVTQVSSEVNFDYPSFTSLLDRLKEEHSRLPGARDVLESYIEICRLMGEFLNPLYGIFTAKYEIITHEAEWASSLHQIRKIERICRSRNCPLPTSWVSCHKLKSCTTDLVAFSNSISIDFSNQIHLDISTLFDIYAHIQDLMEAKWKKIRDKIEKGVIEYNQIMVILNETSATWELVSSQIHAIEGIMKLTSTNHDLTYTNSDLTKAVDDVTEYTTHWKNAGTHIFQYEKILNASANEHSIPKLKVALETSKLGLCSCGPVGKVMEKRISILEQLLNGSVGSLLSEAQFVERVISAIRASNKKQLPMIENNLKVKNWLEICEVISTDLFEIVKLFEFQKVVKEYINTTRNNWNHTAIMWKYECIDFCENGNDKTREAKLWKVKNSDSILYQIDDCMTYMNTYISSKYVEDLADELKEWMNKLSETRTFVEQWTEVENKLSYLCTIFSSTILQKQLHEQAEALNRLLENQESLVDSVKYLMDARHASKDLDKMLTVIYDVEKVLRWYLDDQRFVCPRYFFIRDEELFQIVGQANVDRVKHNISKMFSGIAELHIEDDRICAIVSKESEIMELANHVPLANMETIDLVLALEKEIRNTLQRDIVCSVKELEGIYSLSSFRHDSYFKWVEAYCSQVLIISLSIAWSKKMEAMARDEDIEELITLLTALIKSSSVTEGYSPGLAQKMQQALIFLIYQLQKTRSLYRIDSNAHKWRSCIRYYLNDDGLVELRVASRVYPYGYEFMGQGPNLILTSLTEKCFTSISDGLESNLIGNPQGPAGTGKTESVKALAMLCGYPFLVFNCSDDFDSSAMERTFAGLCQLGAWGIFDEFNRLAEGVLSGVAETVQRIVVSKKNGAADIQLAGRNVQLNSNIGIFVTINPCYISRNSFPLNLKMLCRPIVMDRVDLRQVIYVLLQLSGIEEASNIANDLCNVLNCCGICFTDGIYDFGLRCSKTVIDYIHKLMKTTTPNENIDMDHYATLILEKALVSLLSPQFPTWDSTKFEIILRSCLLVGNTAASSPIHIPNMSDMSFMKLLEEKYAEVLKGDYIKKKALELYHLLGTSKAIVLNGPTGSGKTLCLTVTLELIEALDQHTYDVVRFDPNALDTDELYGQCINGEWRDGLFTFLMRKYSNSEKNVIFIFDGEIAATWVENMNSVLDDNMVLTLSNGNRIQLTPNMKILFETDSLKRITPATVSRCVLIRFGLDDSRYDMRCYPEYFELIEEELILYRYHVLNALLENSEDDSPNFIFSFVNAFGCHMGINGFEELVSAVDRVSKLRGEGNISYAVSEDAILEKCGKSRLEYVISRFIYSSISFVFNGHRGYDFIGRIKQSIASFEQYTIVQMYLSKGCTSSAILDALYKHSVVTQENSQFTMSPVDHTGSNSRMLLLIRDPESVVIERSFDATVYALLRQIVEYKRFYTRRKDADEWITIHVKNVSIVIITSTSEPSMLPQRLRRIMPVINIENFASGDDAAASHMHVGFEKEVDNNVYEANRMLKCYKTLTNTLANTGKYLSDGDNRLLESAIQSKQDSRHWQLFWAMMNYKYGFSMVNNNCTFVNAGNDIDIKIPWLFETDLIAIQDFKERCHFMKSFFDSEIKVLSITNGNMAIREKVCHSVSTCSGHRVASLNSALWNSGMQDILRNTGLYSEKICIFIDWDALVFQSPEMLHALKNIILQGNYTALLTTECVEQLRRDFADADEDVESFESRLLANIQRNLKFVFSARSPTFDPSIVDTGAYLPMPRLSTLFKNTMQAAIMQMNTPICLSTIYDMYIGLCQGHANFCDYLIFVKFTHDRSEKRMIKHESDYTHLRTGIEKIQKAKDEVSSMRDMLDSRREYLTSKNVEAEDKAVQIRKLQAEASVKKKEAEELNLSLEEERSLIMDRNNEVQQQLSQVTPLIEQSQREVEAINRKTLDELRSMSNPPPVIKATMETVVMLLTNSTSTHIAWDACRKFVKASDLISKILTFDAKTLDPLTFSIVKKRVTDDGWDVNRINKASKAAGPLAKWVMSIITYSEIVIQVGPLLDEVKRLNTSYVENETKISQQASILEDLENDITRYESEYSGLLLSINKMQTEIEHTSTRIDRSESLLMSLSEEVNKWKETIQSLESRAPCLEADAILESSMLVLSGSLDDSKRDKLHRAITNVLSSRAICYSYDFSSVLNFDRCILQENMPYRNSILVDAPDLLYPSIIGCTYKTASACDNHFMAILTSSRECKLTLLIKDIVHATLAVKRAIFKAVLGNDCRHGFHILLQISSSDLRRCQHPETEDDHLLLNISELCLILHLKLSHRNFESYCTDILTQEIDPQLHKAHEDVTATIDKLKTDLRNTEDELLEFLVDTSDILDESTSVYLEEYKKKCESLQRSMGECAIIEDRFRCLVSEHSDFTSFISATYVSMKRLESLNSLYNFDVSLLVHAMKLSCLTEERKVTFLRNFFGWINQSIFSEDSIFWCFEVLRLYNDHVEENDDFRQMVDDISSPSMDPTAMLMAMEGMKTKQLFPDVNGLYGYDTSVFAHFNMIIIVTSGLEDPAAFVEAYTRSQGFELRTLAMCTPSEAPKIELAIEECLSEGSWVLLKNAHLAPHWFKKFESQFPRQIEGPKVFITWDNAMELDITILMRRYRIIYQGAETLQSTLHQLYQRFSDAFVRDDKVKYHLMTKSLLVHAIVICRQRYVPFGWTMRCMFDNNDLLLSINATLEFHRNFLHYLSDMSNIHTELYANNFLVNEWRERIFSVYWPKLSTEIDEKIMWEILEFTDPACYPIELPGEDLSAWIQQLPGVARASLIGLPDGVDKIILESRFRQLRAFNDLTTADGALIHHEDVSISDFPEAVMGDAEPLLVAAMRNQWRESCSTYGQTLITAEFRKLAEFETRTKSITTRLHIFSDPTKLLELLRLLVSRSSGVKAEMLELLAAPIEVFEADTQPQSTSHSCDCFQSKETLILDNLELVGASYDFSTSTLAVPANADIDVRQRMCVCLQWVSHSCNDAGYTTLLPVYDSQRLVLPSSSS